MEGKKKSKRGPMPGEPTCKKPKIVPEMVKLSVGDTVIVADKQRLVNSSPYFAALLKFHANNLETVALVPPGNEPLNCFLAVLNCLVNTDVRLNITVQNLRDCIALSEYFQADRIKEECLKSFREMLPTLAMDELLRLWRYGHACAIAKVTTLALVGISLKMESTIQSKEFLDFTVDELVAVMSDNGFLPLVELDVCKAVKSWCNRDGKNRKKKEVLKRVLAEVVWDESTEHLIRSISPQCQKPGELPKRTLNSAGSKIPDDGLLKKVKASHSVSIGDVLYYLRNEDPDDDDYDPGCRGFYRIDMSSKKSKVKELASIDSITTGSEDDSESEYSLCLVRLASGDGIACFGSHVQHLQFMDDQGNVQNMANTIRLYDIATNKWQKLPSLPLTRTGCPIIQCGSFLYITGGKEHQPLDEVYGAENAHCYRLDLDRFTADPNDRDNKWERIADLNAPRTGHKARIQYGRIIVYGGQTRTKIVRSSKTPEDAPCSEAYDPTLNVWTVMKPMS